MFLLGVLIVGIALDFVGVLVKGGVLGQCGRSLAPGWSTLGRGVL